MNPLFRRTPITDDPTQEHADDCQCSECDPGDFPSVLQSEEDKRRKTRARPVQENNIN